MRNLFEEQTIHEELPGSSSFLCNLPWPVRSYNTTQIQALDLEKVFQAQTSVWKGRSCFATYCFCRLTHKECLQ